MVKPGASTDVPRHEQLEEAVPSTCELEVLEGFGVVVVGHSYVLGVTSNVDVLGRRLCRVSTRHHGVTHVAHYPTGSGQRLREVRKVRNS